MSRIGSLVGLVALLTCGVVASATDAALESVGKAGSPVPLPLSAVVLYSSGVGYFQRDGVIEGRGAAELRVKTDSVNDLLKSLVIQDFDGGQISAVTYDSRDPISKALKSFAVDLTSNPSLGQLLEQIRGERIEAAAPTLIQGTILGVEKKREKVGEKDIIEVEYLNLVTADGLRSLPLAQLQRIRLMSEPLNAELRQALEVLASGHDAQRKAVRLEFDGKGRRRVQVGYVVETPVWKTSYRLSLSETNRPFLQGWAIVENTSDEDWNNVKLSLISGRPISFRMDLYEPLYAKRPLVISELYESLRPQVHEQAVADLAEQPAEAKVEQSMGITSRMQAMRAMPSAMPEPALRAPDVDLRQGVTLASRVMEAGELFQYMIRTPLSLPRQQSALLPIVNEEIRGEKLSIYNERVHAKYPMNGFRLKNSTVLHLMQGPITVFDSGIYGGDARIEDLSPGQERIASYALDLKAEVAVHATPEKEEVVTAALRKGTLLVTRKYVEEKSYQVSNRDQKAKVVLIEHLLRPDWRLVEPAEPAERTRDLYRFSVTANAGGGVRLRVREEKQMQQTVRLIDSGSETIGYYVHAKQVSPKVREALQKVVTLRDRLDQTVASRSRLEQRTKDITQEQGRIRENMARLAQNSELYTRYVGKLNQQETEMENLRKEIENLKTTEDRQRRELNDYLLGLDVD